MEKIGIIGIGILGFPLSLILCKAGFQVIGVDVSEEAIKRNVERSSHYEPHVKDYLEKYRKNLTFTDDFNDIERCPVVFIIVQTPLNQHTNMLDMKYVRSALKQVHEVNPACLVVISSTLNIGELRELRKIHRFLSYNPEFIARGKIIEGFEQPKFVLIGAFHCNHADTIKQIWKKVNHNMVFHITNPEEAEITKICSNLSLVVQMNFANVVGAICEGFSVDSNKVLDVLHLDIRNYKAGLGAGGSCFNKDLTSLIETCDKKEIESGANLTAFLMFMNSYWIAYYYNKIIATGKRKIGFLGVAYKPKVPHLDNSQALEIARRLVEARYEVYIYDPYVSAEEVKKIIGKANFCATIEECLDKSEVVFVGTSNFKDVETEKPRVNPWM